jgi:hypothetical protein
MLKSPILFAAGVVLITVAFYCSSCKSCKKSEPVPTVSTVDTVPAIAPQNTINLPHADTSLIPILSKVVDQAFDASAKKDYRQFASLVIYRGPDSLKLGYDLFNAKNSFDKNVLRITADVFNKWNADVDSRNYGRVFEMGQPDGRSMPVLEVIFVSRKNLDRKFFGFLQIKDEWKIADVTSYL